MAMRDFEAAQAEAMELLLQQCVDGGSSSDLQVTIPRNGAASLMDTLARTCEDAGAAVGDMSYADVAASLAHAVTATRESLRNVRESVGSVLDDPEKMRRLCENLQSADHPLLLDADGHDSVPPPSLSLSTTAMGSASPPPNEANVRHMMAFAENMCDVLDDALGTITDDELALTAQLSLGLAQKVLEAGQALFVSLGDDERAKLRDDQAARITVEELPEDGDNDDHDDNDNDDGAGAARRRAARRVQTKQLRTRLKHTAALRTYLESLAVRTRTQAVEHPYMAGALTAVSLPFVGFAVPVASILGVALLIESYYPEHASVTVEMCANFVQMTRLWLLLLKISARQLGVVARECFKSWLEYASTHGFVATGMELASTSLSVGSLCVSRVYHTAVSYARTS